MAPLENQNTPPSTHGTNAKRKKMKLTNFRFVLRDGEKVLQVSHRKIDRLQLDNAQVLKLHGRGHWTPWEDVPLIEEAGEKA